MRRLSLTLLISLTLWPACGGDNGSGNTSDAAAEGGGAKDGATSTVKDSGSSVADGATLGLDSSVTTRDASGASAQVVRGMYLVKTVLGCVDCHTPLNAMGRPDATKAFQGRVCHTDTDTMTMGRGCIHSGNLTNHETGLKNVSDSELKNIITKGMRDNGHKIHPQMPYYYYAQLASGDFDAILAFLRTIPGVDNRIPAHEPPNDTGAAEVIPGIKDSEVPALVAGAANGTSAARGRYLAGLACLNCHTPTVTGALPPARPINLAKAFAGGRSFGAMVRSTNLTPHMTGLSGWTGDQLVKALKEGVDRDARKICPPMPSGPMGVYKDLTDDDARDLANYLLGLPPQDNVVAASMCM